MLNKILKKVAVTKEALIAEHLSIKEKIRNHEVGGNYPSPLLEKVAEEFRKNVNFESNTESFWYDISDEQCIVKNNSVDFHASTSWWYTLVITPVDAQIVERMRTHGNMGARDYWDVCNSCGCVAWITQIDEGICNTCQQK